MSTVPTEEQDAPPVVRRPWRTPRLPDLVGFKEACAILGVQKMSLHRWLKPGSGANTPWGGFGPDKTYMIPPKRVDSGPLWDRGDVERFASDPMFGRQRAASSSNTD
jgi:hypothetical protein